jgi:hypothetical protein
MLSLADAENGGEPVAQRGNGLRGDDLFGLTELRAPLGVAHFGEPDTQLGQHRTAHLAGECTGIRRGDVLRTDTNPGALDDAQHRGNRGIGRDHEQLDQPARHGRVGACDLSDRFGPFNGFRVAEVHLGADTDAEPGLRHRRAYFWFWAVS